MTITKKVTFIAKKDGVEKMKELLSAMVKPSKAEDVYFTIFFSARIDLRSFLQ